jgi:hypothetical protein
MPKTTRHVWVSQPGPEVAPVQGYILEWRRHSYRWSALVLVAEMDSNSHQVTTLQWLPIERLTPVKSDPNNGRAWRWF